MHIKIVVYQRCVLFAYQPAWGWIRFAVVFDMVPSEREQSPRTRTRVRVHTRIHATNTFKCQMER